MNDLRVSETEVQMRIIRFMVYFCCYTFVTAVLLITGYVNSVIPPVGNARKKSNKTVLFFEATKEYGKNNGHISKKKIVLRNYQYFMPQHMMVTVTEVTRHMIRHYLIVHVHT